MDALIRKRLEWMANAKTGDPVPEELGLDPYNWAPAVAEAVKAALDTIDRYESALTVIAESSADKLKAAQAKGALTNIGAKVS